MEKPQRMSSSNLGAGELVRPIDMPGGTDASSVHTTATTAGSALVDLPLPQQPLPIPSQASLQEIVSFPLPVARGLADKMYEKRKQAALEVEKMTRLLAAGGNYTGVHALVALLSRDYTQSPLANTRNGGLIGLAAVAIALGPHGIIRLLDDFDVHVGEASVLDNHAHLSVQEPSITNSHAQSDTAVAHSQLHPSTGLVRPILVCFADHDSRVRYYACESLYNVAKVARSGILRYFNEIFDALSRLSVDVELSVKNGAELLDRLIKDIVTEKSVYYHSTTEQSMSEEDAALTTESMHPLLTSSVPGHSRPGIAGMLGDGSVPGTVALRHISASQFNLPRFIPLLRERIKILTPPGRIFLVQWIFVLNSIPDLELISYLPDFLDGLFSFLSDGNVDVRTATLNVLGEFLKEMRDAVSEPGEGPVPERSSREGRDPLPERCPVSTSQGGLDYASSRNLVDTLVEQSQDLGAGDAEGRHRVPLDFSAMTLILVRHAKSRDEETQSQALQWILVFLSLAGQTILKLTPSLLLCIIPTLSHPESQIQKLAVECNKQLFNLVHQEKKVDLGAIDTLTQLFNDQRQDTRVGTLDWLIMLHKTYSKQAINADVELHKSLLKTLSDYSEEVARRSLSLLSQISKHSPESLTWFMGALLDLFSRDKRLLETRGSLIIRQLSVQLDPERIYKIFADILEKSEDLDFASNMVQNLNLILITAPEFFDMRKRLRNPDRELFSTLYTSWCHNSISLFALCLLAQAYEHASQLLVSISENITISQLIQIDKLVQLLESPVFTPLRLQLLEPEKYPGLYKCLYGILLLLPQSSAFVTLRNRLSSVNTLALMSLKQAKNGNKWSDYLTHFQKVQELHEGKARSSRATTGISSTSTTPTSHPASRKSSTAVGGSLDRAHKRK